MNYNLYPLQENQLQVTNIHIGMRLRERRKQLKLTQQSLAQAINISYQQVQKYEKGANRIGADRLYYLSVLLGVDISYFYKNINDHQEPENKPQSNGNYKSMPATSQEHLQVNDISPAVRVALANLVDVMSLKPTISRDKN